MRAMVKDVLRFAAQTGREFVTGLGNAVSVGHVSSKAFPHVEQDPNAAFQKDWEKLGGDMRRAFHTVTSGGASNR